MRNPGPSPGKPIPSDGFYRFFLSLWIATAICGAILMIVGGILAQDPALSCLGCLGTGLVLLGAGMVITGGGDYAVFRWLRIRDARRRQEQSPDTTPAP